MLRLAPASAALATLPSEEDKEMRKLEQKVEHIRYSAHIPDGTSADLVFPPKGSGTTPPDQRVPSRSPRARSRPLVAERQPPSYEVSSRGRADRGQGTNDVRERRPSTATTQGFTADRTGTFQSSSVSRDTSARRRESSRPPQADREQRTRPSVFPCPSLGSLTSEDSCSDPENGVVPDRYTFHCNDEVNDSQYYFMHVLHAHEVSPVQIRGDGTHPTAREVEVRGWDPTRNLEDLVSVICSDMRRDGLPLLRLKLLKKTHVKRSRRQTIARLLFKRVADCLCVLGRYHKVNTYRDFAANSSYLVCQPIPGSSRYPGSWTLAHAGREITSR